MAGTEHESTEQDERTEVTPEAPETDEVVESEEDEDSNEVEEVSPKFHPEEDETEQDLSTRFGGSDSTDTSEAHKTRQAEIQAAVDEHDRSEAVFNEQVEAASKSSDRPEGEFTGTK